ncbi:MAG: hypothetical protein AAF432_04175 [Planctomycetota bacterium]
MLSIAAIGMLIMPATAMSSRAIDDAGSSRRITGPKLATGQTPLESARNLCTTLQQDLGVPANHLQPAPWPGTTEVAMPLMIDQSTGRPKLFAVRFAHVVDGIPVLDRHLIVVMRNVRGFPVVHANPDVAALGNFSINPVLRESPFDVTAQKTIETTLGITVTQSDRGLAIWTGSAREPHPPVLVRVVVATSGVQRWRVLQDVATGEVVDSRSLLYEVDVEGFAQTVSSDGNQAPTCETTSTRPLPFAGVEHQGNTSFADADGAFAVPDATDPISISLHGRWFEVIDMVNPNVVATAEPSEQLTLTLNEDDDSELDRAQVTAYIEANRVRSFVLDHHPSYPTLMDGPYTIRVNRTDDLLCPANAWYDPDDASMNFCLSNGPIPNTAWSNIVHHEFGHHLIQVAGSGQAEYGEGMSDVIAVLIADDPLIGLGISGMCGVALRNADNMLAFPCNSTSHTCGQMLSGSVWDLRQMLVSTEGDDALDVAAALAINSILLHTGSAIDSSIYLDFLVLDDDDGDLSNGTPHDVEITEAFANHGLLPVPAPDNDACDTALDAGIGTVSGSTAHASIGNEDSCGNATTPDVWYRYVPDKDGTLTVTVLDATYLSIVSLHAECGAGDENLIACASIGCGTSGSTVEAPVIVGEDVLIRVAGCASQRGDFTIELRGEPIAISLMDIAPAFVEPSKPTLIRVAIDDGQFPYLDGSGMLHYRFSEGAFQIRPLIPRDDGTFDALLPAAPCAATPEFYITAMDTTGEMTFMPTAGESAPYKAEVARTETLFADTFERDLGWTAFSVGATAGDWERGAPVNDPEWPFTPMNDADGSGQCYLTENQPGPSDVDDGGVRLRTPVLSAAGGNIAIRYQYFLRKEDIVNADRIRVEISTSGAFGPWTVIDNHTQDTDLEWLQGDIRQSDFFAAGIVPSNNTLLRFTAFDFDPPTLVEAGIDAFEVLRLSCEDTPICHADCAPLGGNDIVDVDDLFATINAFGTNDDFCDITPVHPDGTTGNNMVNIDDVIAVILSFGPCATE